MHRLTIDQILEKKKRGARLSMLTAYDYPFAQILDNAGIDIILVGDSLANVVLGLEKTKDVGMAQMLHHTKAVARAVKKAMVVGDMPYEAYQPDPSQAVRNAKAFIEAGCDAVKLEWFEGCLEVTADIVKAGIAVMGHVGLTPQTAERLGGLIVQGKDAASARKIIEQAEALEAAGCFSIVLECIPDKAAEIITKNLKVPTIGIGAGVHCDGQVLVLHDLLGLFKGYHPKFVKTYVRLDEIIAKTVTQYRDDVLKGTYPGTEHTFHMNPDEAKKLNPNP